MILHQAVIAAQAATQVDRNNMGSGFRRNDKALAWQ